jgi:2-keto-3-deoxy-L-rhamnonate aldolase RhmA
MNNSFIQMLRASGGHPPIGTWLVSASAIVAEAVGCAGFDWAVIDMEHGPSEVMDVLHMLQALGGTKTIAAVRVPSNDAVVVKRVLDAGASTVMFPFVHSAEQARQAVAATRFAPDGVRGVAAMSRASRFGTAPNYFRSANHDVAVIVEIESLRAIDQLDAIAQVAGVDAIFLGMSDLSAALGQAGRTGHPLVVEQMTRAVQRCKALAKPIGTAALTPQAAAQYRAAGFDFIAVASDLGLMMSGAQGVIAALRTASDEHVHTLASGTRFAAP